jgi:hypothetical protein
VLSAWLATLHKDRFIERQPGTTAQPQDWNGAWARGVVSFNGPCSSGLVCAVCLYPREVGSIVADPETLAVTPY